MSNVFLKSCDKTCYISAKQKGSLNAGGVFFELQDNTSEELNLMSNRVVQFDMVKPAMFQLLFKWCIWLFVFSRSAILHTYVNFEFLEIKVLSLIREQIISRLVHYTCWCL